MGVPPVAAHVHFDDGFHASSSEEVQVMIDVEPYDIPRAIDSDHDRLTLVFVRVRVFHL